MNSVRSIAGLTLLPALILGGLQGCEVGPDYHRPATTLPASFSVGPPATQPSASPSTAVDITRWWESLDDPELNSLVRRALVANPDLQMALMRLQQARAQELVATGVEFPAFDASAGAGRGTGTNSVKGRIPGPLNAGTNTTGYTEITEVAGFDALWEVDLFGGLKRQVEAARYSTQAAAEARNDVLITLVSDVARDYLDYRFLQLQLKIVQDEITAEEQSANLVEARFQRGFTNELDPQLAKRELASMQSQVAPLQASIQQSRRQLAVLLGEFPDDLASELNSTSPLPRPPDRIEPGLPVELLRRRPDIRQAERQLAASTAQIGVAVDALYPHVLLSGGAGIQGQGLGRLPLKAQFDGSIGPALYWPLLDFGTLDAQIETQDYRTRELLIHYQRTILAAVQEVDDAISNFQAQQSRLQSLTVALTAAQRAVQIASQRYDRGFTNFLDVLDAQRELYTLQYQHAAAAEEVTVQYIALYKALGGGWENNQNIPAIRRPRPAIIATFHPSYSSEHGDQ